MGDDEENDRFEVGFLGAEVLIGAGEPEEIRARLYEIERRILLIEARLSEAAAVEGMNAQ